MSHGNCLLSSEAKSTYPMRSLQQQGEPHPAALPPGPMRAAINSTASCWPGKATGRDSGAHCPIPCCNFMSQRPHSPCKVSQVVHWFAVVGSVALPSQTSASLELTFRATQAGAQGVRGAGSAWSWEAVRAVRSAPGRNDNFWH